MLGGFRRRRVGLRRVCGGALLLLCRGRRARGCSASGGLRLLCLLALEELDLLALGDDDHRHPLACEPRLDLDLAQVGEALGDIGHAHVAAALVRELAPLEVLHDLHAVPLDEELARLLDADVHIMRVDLHRPAETDFLHLARLALALAGLVLLGLLVLVLAVVHDADHRRTHVRRNLHKVVPRVVRAALGLIELDDAHHLAVLVNQPDRADPDAVIDARALRLAVGWTAGEVAQGNLLDGDRKRRTGPHAVPASAAGQVG